MNIADQTQRFKLENLQTVTNKPFLPPRMYLWDRRRDCVAS